MDWKTLFFSPDGRIGRQSFWIGWLVLLGVNVVLGWIPLIGWALSLVTIYCNVCITAKRLHDMGKSGFLQIIPLVACPTLIVGAIVAVAGPAIMAGVADANEAQVTAAILAGVGGMMLFFLAAFAIGLGFLIWIGVSNTQPGENRYGPEPTLNAIA
ncbi:MAG: DUF805 domain-containing protein [Caulobacter sp.]